MGPDSCSHFSHSHFLVILFVLQVTDIVACPKDWLSHRNSCFGLFTNIKMSWNDAEVACQSKASGGHLATISSEIEMKSISSFISRNYGNVGNIWIGLQDGGRAPNRIWQWEDLSPVVYSSWAPGQPKGVNEKCATLISPGYLKWSADVCSKLHGYLCQFLLF
ncbi:C-type lectin-like [Anolis carolinensis]|uniref:C-type lectin-like n=1 Tax=Anolis carolinensis TaxID=28377 RepID=UPI002F2B40CF